MSSNALDVKDFRGIVQLHDWFRAPDGKMYLAIAGKVTILSAKEAVGWEPTGHNSANWLARIAGDSSSINLMGCQVRLVYEGEIANPELRHPDTYYVP